VPCIHIFFLNAAGMLTKSKGQILHIAATLHVLFNLEAPKEIPTVISEAAIKGAIDLTDLCIQCAAFLAGRGTSKEIIQEISEGN